MPHSTPKSMLPLGAAVAAAGLIAMVSGAVFAGPSRADTPPSAVDFDGYLKLSADVGPLREARLINLAQFNHMKAEPGTLIIDARSADAFARGHITGAVNFTLADFTAEDLAAVIGNKDRRILIYCNNNFTDDIRPIMLKSAPLALNIATFINLHGYGYKNVYELSGAYSIEDSEINWTRSTVQEN